MGFKKPVKNVAKKSEPVKTSKPVQKSKKSVSIFTERLQEMSDQANEAMNTYTPDGDLVPEGVYNAIEQCSLKESKKSGKLMISRNFTILDGDYKGRKIFDNIVFEGNEIGWHQARRWTEAHNKEWPGEGEDMSIIEQNILDINTEAPKVQIRNKLTTDKNDPTSVYPNVSVLKMLGDDYEEDSGNMDDENVDTDTNEDTEDSETIAVDLESMNRKELKEFIDEHEELSDIRVTVKMSDDDIREAIKELMGSSEDVEDSKSEEQNEDNEEASGDLEFDAETLLAFCAAQGIDEVNDEMEATRIMEVMKTYQYKREDLTEEEYEMCKSLELQIIATPKKVIPSSKKIGGKK